MYYVHTPGLKVVAPGTAYDAKGLMKAAIRDEDPVLYLEHKFLYRRVKEELPTDDYVVPIGKAATRRSGDDLAILTYGAMLHPVLEAAEILAQEDGAEVEVLDLRSLLPLDDEAILEAAKKTGKVLIVHEDTRTGGIAAEITARINEGAFEWLDGPVLRLTAPDTPVPYSPPMEKLFLPSREDVLQAARDLYRY
jgi:2-oxoisovalerate dehydrogenase E1 component beta subunit